MKKLTKFIYKGIYYPVIGSSVGWVNGNTSCVLERRFGGWMNADKWWSFSYGIHCRLLDHKKPYRQFVIDEIEAHPEMQIVKRYYSFEDTAELDNYIDGCMTLYSVETLRGEHIGDIRDAYFLTPLRDLRTYGNGSNQICRGFNPEDGKIYGWSHRAKVGFTQGDRIFEEEFGTDRTPYVMHGSKEIKTYEDAMLSALNFAKSVA